MKTMEAVKQVGIGGGLGLLDNIAMRNDVKKGRTGFKTFTAAIRGAALIGGLLGEYLNEKNESLYAPMVAAGAFGLAGTIANQVKAPPTGVGNMATANEAAAWMSRQGVARRGVAASPQFTIPSGPMEAVDGRVLVTPTAPRYE